MADVKVLSVVVLWAPPPGLVVLLDRVAGFRQLPVFIAVSTAAATAATAAIPCLALALGILLEVVNKAII